MLRKLYTLPAILFFTLISIFANAQDSTSIKKVDMADALRSNGKIYIVIAVLLTILAGIIFYLVRLDRKITKLEKSSSAK